MVSVVIPTYQREEAIVRALEGVIRQTYWDIEILVIDDNGEGTEHQLATAKAVGSVQDPRIRYIAHPRNMGGCAARNTGIRRAAGEYIAFLDDDDIWSDRFIDAMLPRFSEEKVGAVYCNFFSYNGTYSISGVDDSNHEGNVYELILSGWCPSSTSLFIVKKSRIIQAGLFDENLKSFQDYDMWLRLSRICEFAYVKERLVLKYEGFGEQTSKKPERRLAGYQAVVKKYSNSLSKSELILFRKFIEQYYYDSLYRTIIYRHNHNLNYKTELKEYLIKHNSLLQKLHIRLRLILPTKMYYSLGMLVLRFDKNRIVYKGKYPV